MRATLDAAGFQSGINSMKSAMSGLESHAVGIGGKVGNALAAGAKIAITAFAAIGTAIAGAVVASTSAFMGYEQSMANVSKTVDATAEQLKVLGDSNRQLAIDSGVAVESLNGVSATLGSLGVAYEAIAKTTDLVAKGSIAFGMDAEEMATKVSKISTVYKVPIEQSEKYLSAMNALGNATAATEPQILSFTQAFGPMATMFNVPIEKVAAFGATLISSGVDAEEGATSIRSALEYAMNGPDLKMDESTKAQIAEGANAIKQQYLASGKSASEASEAAKEYATAQKVAFNAANPGNTRMTDWAKLLGTDVKSLNQMLNQDFLGTMAKSSAALDKIQSSTDKSKKAFDIWGSYGFKVMGTMSSQAENLDKNLKVVYDDATSGSKSMTSEFERQNNTLQGSWDKLKAGINDVGISIGETTSGPIKNMMDSLTSSVPKVEEFIGAFMAGDWSKVGQMMKDGINLGIEAVKDLLSKLGDFIKSLPWPDWFKAAGEAIENAPWGEWANSAIDILSSALETGINAAVQLGQWIYDHAIVYDWGALGQSIATRIGDGIQSLIKTMMDIGGWIHDKIRGWIDGNGPKELGTSIATFLGDGIKAWLDGDTSIWDTLKTVWGTMSDWLGMGWEIIKGIGSGILDKIWVYLTPAKNAFVNWVADVGLMFVKLGSTISESIVGGLKIAAGYLDSFVTTLGRTIPGLASSLGGSSPVNNGSGVNQITLKGVTGTRYKTTDGQIFIDPNTAYKHQNEISAMAASASISIMGFDEGVSSGLIDTSDESKKKTTALGEMYNIPVGTSAPSKAQEEAWAKGYSNAADLALEQTDKTFTYTGFTDTIKQLDNALKGIPNDIEAWRKANLTTISEEKTASEKQLANDQKAAVTWLNAATKLEDVGTGFAGKVWTAADAWKAMGSQTADYMAGTLTNSANAASAITASGAQQNTATLSQGYQAVRMGLTEDGKQIAVIGQVAQRQFEQAGGTWVTAAGAGATAVRLAGEVSAGFTTGAGKTFASDTSVAGKPLVADGILAGSNLKNDGSIVGTNWKSDGQVAGNYLTSGGDLGGKSFYTWAEKAGLVINTAATHIGQVLGGWSPLNPYGLGTTPTSKPGAKPSSSPGGVGTLDPYNTGQKFDYSGKVNTGPSTVTVANPNAICDPLLAAGVPQQNQDTMMTGNMIAAINNLNGTDELGLESLGEICQVGFDGMRVGLAQDLQNAGIYKPNPEIAAALDKTISAYKISIDNAIANDNLFAAACLGGSKAVDEFSTNQELSSAFISSGASDVSGAFKGMNEKVLAAGSSVYASMVDNSKTVWSNSEATSELTQKLSIMSVGEDYLSDSQTNLTDTTTVLDQGLGHCALKANGLSSCFESIDNMYTAAVAGGIGPKVANEVGSDLAKDKDPDWFKKALEGSSAKAGKNLEEGAKDAAQIDTNTAKDIGQYQKQNIYDVTQAWELPSASMREAAGRILSAGGTVSNTLSQSALNYANVMGATFGQQQTVWTTIANQQVATSQYTANTAMQSSNFAGLATIQAAVTAGIATQAAGVGMNQQVVAAGSSVYANFQGLNENSTTVWTGINAQSTATGTAKSAEWTAAGVQTKDTWIGGVNEGVKVFISGAWVSANSIASATGRLYNPDTGTYQNDPNKSWGSGPRVGPYYKDWSGGGPGGVGVKQPGEKQPPWMPPWTNQAEGGILDSPVFYTADGGLRGFAGEAGREAFVPLDDKAAGWNILRQILPEFGINAFANGGFTSSARGGKTNITVNSQPAARETLIIVVDTSGKELTRQIMTGATKKLKLKIGKTK